MLYVDSPLLIRLSGAVPWGKQAGESPPWCVVGPIRDYDELIVMAQWQASEPVRLQAEWTTGEPFNQTIWDDLLPHAGSVKSTAPYGLPTNGNLMRLSFPEMRGCSARIRLSAPPTTTGTAEVRYSLITRGTEIILDPDGRFAGIQMFGNMPTKPDEALRERLYVAIGKRGLEQLIEDLNWWPPDSPPEGT